MRTRLPPLDDLFFVLVTARRNSFSRAAAELGVTQTAMSYRVARLEGLLGFKIFDRMPRKIRLTESGADFIRRIEPYIDGIEQTWGDFKKAHPLGDRPQRRLRISVLPSFAACCLVSRFASLTAHLQGVLIEIVSELSVVSPGRSGVDCCIRYGRGGWNDCVADLLYGEFLSPVCTPELRERALMVGGWRALPVLHDVNEVAWEQWVSATQSRQVPLGPVLSDSAQLVQACLDGAGTILGRSVLVGDHLSSGRLVRLEEPSARSPNSYWLVRRPGDQRPEIDALAEWLRTVFQADPSSAS